MIRFIDNIVSAPLKARVAYLTLFAVTALGFGALLICNWFDHDEWWYFAAIINGSGGSEGMIGDNIAGGIAFSVEHHRIADNFRLGNIVATCLMALSFRAGTIATALIFVAALALMCRISGLTPSTLKRFVLFVGLVVFYLPWKDSLLTYIFAYNYVWGMFWMALCIWMFLKPVPRHAPVAFLAGCVAGWWHEGFGIPLLCGAVALTVLYARYRTARHVAMEAGLVCGFGLLLCSHYFRAKLSGSSAEFSHVSVYILMHHFAIFVNVALWIWLVAKGGARRRLALSPVVIMLSAISLSGLYIHLTGMTLRSGMAAFVATAMLMPVLAGGIVPRQRCIRYAATAGAAAVYALVCIHLALAVKAAVETRATIMAVTSAYINKDYDSCHTVFADITYPWQYPVLQRGKTVPMFYYYKGTRRCLNQVYEHGPLYIVPEELKEYTERLGRPIAGNAGMREYKGHLICRADSVADELESLNARFGGSRSEAVYALLFERFYGKDGQKYVFCNFIHSISLAMLGELRSIDLLEPTEFDYIEWQGPIAE